MLKVIFLLFATMLLAACMATNNTTQGYVESETSSGKQIKTRKVAGITQDIFIRLNEISEVISPRLSDQDEALKPHPSLANVTAA